MTRNTRLASVTLTALVASLSAVTDEPCAECSGTGRVRSLVRRSSREEPHTVEHTCPVCEGRAPQMAPEASA